MSDSNLTIWSNMRFPTPAETLLRDGLGEHRLVISPHAISGNLAATPADPALSDADIAFGQPDPDALLAAPRIKWVHLTSAGYTRYDTNAFRAACRDRGLVVTNSSAVYAEPCAQHVAAFLYAHARQLAPAMRDQLTTQQWRSHEIRAASRLLNGQRMLIYGFGAIGRRLVELMAPLNMQIMAVRRSPAADQPVATVTPAEADAQLGQADIVVNILPANPDSEGFFSADRLNRVKPGAVLVNIGRGSTVDQDALLAALDDGRLAAALLDVTTSEPLPPDHPLWRHPACVITPHSAGGFAGEHDTLVRHFLDNLERFGRQAPLHDRII